MNKPLFPDVSVNGQEISAADIAAEAQNHNAPKDKPGWAWRAGARALVIRELLLQEARKRDLQPKPQELEPGKFETEDESLIRDVLDLAMTPKVPTPDQIAAVYAAKPDMFRAPTLYEPSHILFAADPADTKARLDANTKALAALATLKSSPKDFAHLAKELSDCPSRDMGGQLGQLVSGDTVPEFEAAMDGLQAGETCAEPVPTRYGIHILRLDAIAIGDVLPLERVQDQISEMLEKAGWATAANEYVNSLVAGAEITGIDMAAAA
ncbi:MAG: peptidylprolyl isomerase [Marinosulfonomonas sp.]|nr:peptidylprolyl isomerase [Marinosulfonomonas sp.]